MPKPRTLRRAATLSRRLEQIGTTVNLLTYEKIVDLVRRDEESAEVDGYPSRSSGAPGGGRGQAAVRITDAGESDSVALDGPTESAAFARLEPARERDWIAVTIREIGDVIREMTRLARRLDRKVSVVLHAGDARYGRPTSLTQPCIVDACQNVPVGVGDDRLRSGLCPACYKAWTRWKTDRPGVSDPGADRRAYVAYRSARLDAEKTEAEWRIRAIDQMQASGDLPRQATA